MANFSYEARDLLRVTASEGVILHQINCQGIVGGLNKAICDKYPANLATASTKSDFGAIRLVLTGKVAIANASSQIFPGHAQVLPADSYANRRKALLGCLQQVHDWLKAQSEIGQTIYIPYCLACSMAGDRWSDVSELIRHWAFEAEADVVVCVPNWAEDKARAKGYLATT